MTDINSLPISEQIRQRLDNDGVRYHACDNISEYIDDLERVALVDELAEKFEDVLDSLIIDRKTDPNSMDTPRRLAKMYVNELMHGRYYPGPNVTAFPNFDEENYTAQYNGIIVTRAEIISMCSHHHQPVKGVCYIGLLPKTKVIGLSKYVRIARHCARRGQLQEELTTQIANEIEQHTGAKDIGVYIQATHGCMENRGVCAHSSLTQTAVMRGQFFKHDVKAEFLEYIKMQQQFAGNKA